MKVWRLKPVAALLLTGLCQTALAGTAMVYYYTPTKNWSRVFIHHNGSGDWTGVPGQQMDAACANWTAKEVDFGSASTFQAVFNNGDGAWDNLNNQGGNNYVIGAGTHQVKDGKLQANAGSPCGTQPKNSATVFYKPNGGWNTVNIHYAPKGGNWTTPPGIAMDAACTGWKKKTIELGTASGLTVTFNNGSSWDNNSGRDYSVGTGNIKIENGAVAAGNPCGDGGDTVAPSVPTGLTAGTVTTDTIALTWTASEDNTGGSGMAGYDVYRNDVLIGSSTTAAYSDSGLSAGTAYRYTVVAKDKSGNKSAASTVLNASTKPGESNTAQVYYLIQTNGWSTANLHYAINGGSWTTVPGVAMEAACPGWVQKTVALGSAKGLTVAFNNGSGVWDSANGKNYSLGSGVTTIKNGVVTPNAVSPCAADTLPPPVPTGLTQGDVTSISVGFSWKASIDDISGTAGYRIYRNDALIATVTTTSYTATGLEPDTTYRFTVAAFDKAGNVSAKSTVLSIATDKPDTIAPTAPSGLSKGTVLHNAVPLNWVAATDNVGVTGYEIHRNGTRVGTATGTSYTDNAVAAATTYRYTVRAKDAAGNVSPASAELSVTTPEAPIQQLGTPIGTDMREDSVYFVMTARFYDGDPSNNRGGQFHAKNAKGSTTDTNAANNDPMFRGDFKGLIDKLDYIKALGFSAIWITPVVLNRSDYDYHGYHGYDFFRVDGRLESPGATYQDLINAAHAKGIKIIQDVVYNHSSRWGEKNLFAPKVFGVRDTQWSWYYDEPNPNFTYNGVSIEPKSGKSHYTGDLWSTEEPAGNTCRNWGVPMGYSQEGYRIYNCQWPNPTSGMFPKELFHQCWIGNWEGEDARSCWIHEDLADFNTENAKVQKFLIDVYNKYIDMGVDGFRIDTAVHVPRIVWNRHFLPAAQKRAVEKFGEKGRNFYMVGEVGAFVNDKWNRGSSNHSAQYFTWKEHREFSADDAVAAKEQYEYENARGTHNQPTSDNAFLKGNNYHAPDHSKFSGMNVIDMRMHMNFSEAKNAFWNGKDSDDSYNDATYNLVYVDSHDYGPNKSSTRYTGGTDAWAENMSLMWTFRGIPTLYYGSEIEFQKGAQIDCGPTCALAKTGRAYYGEKIEGSVTASDFGVVGSASGNVATTLSYPLVKHVQRLNQIRRKIPALQKGQYSTEGVSGEIAYKRRYTANGVDSFALVAVSSTATFTGIPNGTYKDAVTGDVKTVTNGTLTAAVSGKGNARIYVLDTAATPAPGKIGADGPYLKP